MSQIKSNVQQYTFTTQSNADASKRFSSEERGEKTKYIGE